MHRVKLKRPRTHIECAKLFERLSRIARMRNIAFVTATQPTRLHVAPLWPSRMGFDTRTIVIDYV